MILLLMADLHIRADQPECRLDNFYQMQKKTLDFIYQTAKENNAFVIIAGDIFNTPQPTKSQKLEILLQSYFNRDDISTAWIAGNHDLPYHNYNNYFDCSLGVLDVFNKHYWCNTDVHYFNFCNYNELINIKPYSTETFNTLVQHIYCTPNNLPEYIENGITAQTLLKKYPEYDIIVTGDNHQGFHYEENNRFVINPGCSTRQKSDMQNYKPRVYLFDTHERKLDTIYLPDNKLKDVSTKHILEKTNKRERLDNFIDGIPIYVKKGMALNEALNECCIENKIGTNIQNYLQIALQDKNVKEKLIEYWSALDDGKVTIFEKAIGAI